MAEYLVPIGVGYLVIDTLLIACYIGAREYGFWRQRRMR